MDSLYIMKIGFLSIFNVFSFLMTTSILGSVQTIVPDRTQAHLRVLSSNEELVDLQLTTPAYEIMHVDTPNGGADIIHVPGIPNDATPGELRLPKLSRLVAIPPGTDYQLSYQSPKAQKVTGEYTLQVAGKTQTPEIEFTAGTYQPDEIIQNLDIDPIIFLPHTPVKVSEEAWLRGQRMVRLDIFPFQYNPSDGRLVWHPLLNISLSFRGPAVNFRTTSLNQSVISPLDNLAEELVINPSSARLWRDPAWQTSADIPLTKTTSTTDFDETRYKITVTDDGLYEVTGESLQAAGLELASINPQNFSLSNQGSPVAIQVLDASGNDGETDMVFSSTDRVVFYGEKFRGDRMAERYASEDDLWAPMPTGWQPQMTAEMFEKYTDKNVYWLDINGPAGLRMDAINGIPTGVNQILLQSTTTVHVEQDNRWYTVHNSDEDTWFWEVINLNPTIPIVNRTYLLELPAATASIIPAVLHGEIYAASESLTTTPDHYVELAINGHPIGDFEWDGMERLSFTEEFDQSFLVPGTNQLTLSSSLLPGMGSDSLFVDWFELTYTHRLHAQSDQLFFHYPEQGSIRQYRIGGFSNADVNVFDITNPLEPVVIQILPGSLQGDTYLVEFQAQHPQTAHYLVTGSPRRTPLEVASYTFKNLHSLSMGADYLIVAHENFVPTAQALADYRSTQGLRSIVVDLEDIINEFNDGIYHSLAIKSFLAYTMANWIPPAPSYVVLVGSGHWNFFYRPGPTGNYSDAPIYMPPHLVWVDPWQGEVDSASALAMIVGNDLLPDLAIGRIPVDTAEEFATIINKIITYENRAGMIQPDRLLLIADNQPDEAGNFMSISDDVIGSSIPDYQILNRVYLNDFFDLEDGACEPEQACPEATDAIVDTINHGELDFINYTGHGSITYWANELLLRTTSLPDRVDDPRYNDLVRLNNAEHLPILLSMTCLDGYWIYPSLGNPSLAVNLLKKAGGGVSAAYSPTGLGLAHGHDVLNKAFYDSVYRDGAGDLATAVQYSKLKLYETGQNFDLIYTFTVFGDPALRLATTPGTVFIPFIANP